MRLKLRVSRFKGEIADQVEQTFDEAGGTIGRGPMNDWVLPDPSRYVSEQHALISYRDHRYHLTDTSTNGVYINNAAEKLGRGNSHILAEGDVLVFGDYQIEVALSGGAGVEPARRSDSPTDLLQQLDGLRQDRAGDKTPSLMPGADVFPAEDDSDPLAQTLEDVLAQSPPDLSVGGDIGTDDSIVGARGEPDNLLDEVSPPPATFAEAPEEPHVAPEHEVFKPPEPIPEDWDAPLQRDGEAKNGDGGVAAHEEHPVQIPADWASPSNGETPASPEQRLDEAPEAAPFVKPAHDVPDTVDAAEVEQAVIRAAGPSVLSPGDQADELQSAPAAPPRVTPPGAEPAPAAPPPVTAAPATPSRAESVVMQELLAGAKQSNLQISPDELPEKARVLGELLRVAVDGTIDVLRGRSGVRQELGMQLTTIRPTQNNPLKFSPNGDEALRHLLAPSGPGYLAPVDAMEEAFDDIKSHQVAVMAGVQAALKSVLKRFDPAVLEERLRGDRAMLDMLPMHRKARMWELFIEYYKEIVGEAEGEFDDAFQHEFARAYEEHVRALQIAKTKGSS